MQRPGDNPMSGGVDWWGLEILLPPPTLEYLSVSLISA